MKRDRTIRRRLPEGTAIDFVRLRELGIQRLEQLATGQWTDFNTHDPGITILEALCYAITDEVVLLAYGEPGVTALRETLTALSASSAANPSPLPAGVAERLARAPGWSSVAAVRIAPWLASQLAAAADRGEGARAPAVWLGVLRTAAELVEQHGLGHAVLASRWDKAGSWSLRWIW